MKKFKKSETPYTVLHADENHLAVVKAAGVHSIPDRNGAEGTSLLELLKEVYPTATLVHRIDAETSGIVLVALNQEAMRYLSKQFEERLIHKEYICFVKGFVPFEEIVVNRPVGKETHRGETTVRRDGPDSETLFRRLRTYKNYAKLACCPKTGRTHQIRIHLADMGLPIVGDTKYGGAVPYLSEIKKRYNRAKGEDLPPESPLIKRFALHARAITYLPLGSEEQITLECPEPNDIRIFQSKLEKYA